MLKSLVVEIFLVINSFRVFKSKDFLIKVKIRKKIFTILSKYFILIKQHESIIRVHFVS